MEHENYGALVKKLRIDNNLTQNQVAESLGVTPGYISNVENGRTAMSLRMLTYYARLVGCSLDSLFLLSLLCARYLNLINITYHHYVPNVQSTFFQIQQFP